MVWVRDTCSQFLGTEDLQIELKATIWLWSEKGELVRQEPTQMESRYKMELLGPVNWLSMDATK